MIRTIARGTTRRIAEVCRRSGTRWEAALSLVASLMTARVSGANQQPGKIVTDHPFSGVTARPDVFPSPSALSPA